jgi:hypothetical protein
VIDKVDFQIPEGTPPGPALAETFRLLRRQPVSLFRSSRFYTHVADLRKEFGIDAVVHLFYRFGRATHKVEIIDAGKKPLWEMAEIITQLFDVGPSNLRLIRVDLAADIEDVPVYWFRNHAYVSRKQFSSRISKSHDAEVEFVAMGTGDAQTLYAGKRPNLIRVYNKLAEWFRQYTKLERGSKRFNAGIGSFEMSDEQRFYGSRYIPTFEGFCRGEGHEYKPHGILTRIERQIGGGRFPSELSTFGDLRYAHELAPFRDIRLEGSEPIRQFDPQRGVSLRNHLAAIGYQQVQKELGSIQQAHSFVFKHANGNGKRLLECFEACSPKEREPITMEDVQQSYRKSTMLQTSQLPQPEYT